METPRLCPECHAPLPPDVPPGQCPRCLLQPGARRDSASAPTATRSRGTGLHAVPSLMHLGIFAVLLIVAAVFVPKPGDLQEPATAVKVFQPLLLLTPDRGSYRFVGYRDGEWKKFTPVFAVNRMVNARQEITRTFGWDSQRGASPGFFQRTGSWRYQLIAPRFDWKAGDPGPMEIPPAEVQKLRPVIVAELDRIQPGQGRLLERLLDYGEDVSTVVCWQNGVVLLAWLMVALAVLALGRWLWSARTGKSVLIVLATLIALPQVHSCPRPADPSPPVAVALADDSAPPGKETRR